MAQQVRLPANLRGSCESYKEDEAKFLEWLSETVTSIGWMPALSGGMKWYQTLEKTSDTQGNDVRNFARSQHLTVKDYGAAAEAVANARQTVPNTISRALIKCISEREQLDTFYYDFRHLSEEVRTQNDRHIHHTMVMQQVYQKLQPLFTEPKSKELSSASVIKSPPEPTLSSAVVAKLRELDIEAGRMEEECSSAGASSASISLASSPKANMPRIRKPDESFAIDKVNVLYEAAVLKDHVLRRWKLRWTDHPISISELAMVTNVAIDLCRGLEEELCQKMKSSPDFRGIFLSLCENRVSDEHIAVDTLQGTRTMIDAGISCLNRGSNLRRSYDILRKAFHTYHCKYMQTKSTIDEELSYRDWKAELSPWHKDEADTQYLVTCLALAQESRLRDGMLDLVGVREEGIKSLLEFVTAASEQLDCDTLCLDNPQLSLVFATDLHLAIYHEIVEHRDEIFDDMYVGFEKLEVGFSDARKRAISIQCDSNATVFLSQNQERCAKLKTCARIWKEDVKDESQLKIAMLLSLIPSLGGLLIWTLQTMLLNHDLRTSDASNAALQSVHLYDIITHERSMTVSWPDMENVMDIYGKGYLLAGKSSDIRNYCRRYRLALGFLPQQEAQGRIVQDKKRLRLLTPNVAPITRLTAKRLLRRVSAPDRTILATDYLPLLVMAKIQHKEQKLPRVLIDHKGNIENVPELRKHARKHGKMPISTFLVQLSDRIQEDQEVVSFGFGKVLDNCLELRERLYTHEKLAFLRDSRPHGPELVLSTFLIYFENVAEGFPKLSGARLLNCRSSNGISIDDCLTIVGDVLDNLLKQKDTN